MIYSLSQILSEYSEKNTENKYEPVAVGKYGIRKRSDIYKKELASDYSKNKLIYKDTLTIGLGSKQIDFGVLIDNNTFSVSPAYKTFRINTSIVSSKYLECCLKANNSYYTQKYMIASARQGKKVDVENLLNEKLDIPCLEQQIELLDKIKIINRAIEKDESLLELHDELIKSRFVEMFGEPSANPNRFTIVPFENVVQYMGDIGSNGANKVVVEHLDMKDEEDYALMVRFLNFTKNDFSQDVKYISKESYDFFKKSQIFGGELVFCKIGSAGSNYVMPYLNRPVSLGLNQIMVRINDNVLMPYLYQYLHTEYGELLISGCINGAVTKSITKTELKKLPLMLPPISLQKQFAAFVEQTDKSKLAIQKRLELYEELSNKKMYDYFNNL